MAAYLLVLKDNVTGFTSVPKYVGYYSSPKGAVQLLTFTSANLPGEYRSRPEKFLDGFVAN